MAARARGRGGRWGGKRRGRKKILIDRYGTYPAPPVRYRTVPYLPAHAVICVRNKVKAPTLKPFEIQPQSLPPVHSLVQFHRV